MSPSILLHLSQSVQITKKGPAPPPARNPAYCFKKGPAPPPSLHEPCILFQLPLDHTCVCLQQYLPCLEKVNFSNNYIGTDTRDSVPPEGPPASNGGQSASNGVQNSSGGGVASGSGGSIVDSAEGIIVSL